MGVFVGYDGFLNGHLKLVVEHDGAIFDDPIWIILSRLTAGSTRQGKRNCSTFCFKNDYQKIRHFYHLHANANPGKHTES